MTYRTKLIEVAIPLDAINRESAREKSIRHGHPSTLHLWWARRPLAACRAVLFCQLVDDPSAWPSLFPTEEDQDRERRRLFGIIEDLVKWDNAGKDQVINAARREIARSVARGRQADGDADKRDAAVLSSDARPATINAYLEEVAPPIYDPFAGGGSIPLEAQRLGLRAIASDLNPVAVLINKALIDLPVRFANQEPVNPEAAQEISREWRGAAGLAEDVRFYGKWIRDEALKRIGDMYPEVVLPDADGSARATVLAWLWARTVRSPDPTAAGIHVPLVSSYWLCKKKGREAYLVPVVDRAANTFRFEVHEGRPSNPGSVDRGTKTGRGDFRCLLTGSPIPAQYVREQGASGALRSLLLAVVVDTPQGRRYLPSTPEQVDAASTAPSDDAPETSLPEQALGFRVQAYGLSKHKDLFSPRQQKALVCFSDLVSEARSAVLDAVNRKGGNSDYAQRYADAVATYLAFAVSKATTRNCVLAIWEVGMGRLAGALGRQAISMVPTFAETNPLAGAGGDIFGTAGSVAEVLDALPKFPCQQGEVSQRNLLATSSSSRECVVATDPPYYDNVPYADLSDWFYVWLRKSLRMVHPNLFTTVLVPKEGELIAEPARHGGPRGAESFFREGMQQALRRLVDETDPAYPSAVYYAFKQAERDSDGVASTGWEAFLHGMLRAGLQVTCTWPIRTEQGEGLRSIGRNALASSILLSGRPRASDAEAIPRAEFLRQLRSAIPTALRRLQHGNVAPVDLAQSAIGPGIAIFSAYERVLESDGSEMSVGVALRLINETLDQHLEAAEGQLDPATRFAATWFDAYGYEPGPFGEAETLAKARNVSVQRVVDAGILRSGGGRVRLLSRNELPETWEPSSASPPTVWEAAQYLVIRLEVAGEGAAAELLRSLGSLADPTRDLAYRLFNMCERKKLSEEARAFNALVVAWPELERLAARTTGPQQQLL